jgi:hypothetical protein
LPRSTHIPKQVAHSAGAACPFIQKSPAELAAHGEDALLAVVERMYWFAVAQLET